MPAVADRPSVRTANAAAAPVPRWAPPAAEPVAPLDAAVVVCCRRDLWQARACVAGLRHWEPDLLVELLFDEAAGRANLRPFERLGVRRFPASRARFGSPLSKLDVLFRGDGRRVLVLDADCVPLGPVRGLLERFAGDFVVSPNHVPAAKVAGAYFDPAAVAAAFPGYEYPGWVFNSGQFVTTCGVLNPSDLDGLVEWPADPAARPRCLRKDLMPLNDQPRLNFALHRLRGAGRVSVDGCRFKRNPSAHPADLPAVADLAAKSDRCPPAVLHWMGQPGVAAGELTRGDVFRFYERMFFAEAGCGWERPARSLGRRAAARAASPLPKSVRSLARRIVGGG